MNHDLPTFQHDTRRIVEVNDAACKLFRCDRIALVDAAMLDLVHEDMRPLAALRLKFMRDPERDPSKPLPDITYSFVRCDRSVFYATLHTIRLECGLFETVVIFKYNW